MCMIDRNTIYELPPMERQLITRREIFGSLYKQAVDAMTWCSVHGGSYGSQKAAYYLRKLADQLDPKEDTVDTPTDQGDEIIVEDEESGITFVFRGRKMYKIVDGKEVLMEGNNGTGKDRGSKTTSD